MMPQLVPGKMKHDMENFRPGIMLNIIGAIVLLVGLGSAFLVYRSAEIDLSTALGYEVGYDGSVYPIMPDDSKTYLRSLELYNGKAGVMMDQFRRWFIGLWHGKKLAFTLAFMTIFISIGFFYVANTSPSQPDSDGRYEDSGHENDIR